LSLQLCSLPFFSSGHHRITTQLLFKGNPLRIQITSSCFMSVCLFGIPSPLSDCFQ
ncbi:hypothetical protein LEMLEM_LOCUS7239, partial [Lemmus lemmus]